MRTKTLLTAAAALVAGVISSNAQVYSANIVGYINKPLPAGLTLFANQLNNGANDLNTLIPNAGFGDTVYVWTGSAFNSSVYVGTWGPDLTLNPGQAAFYQGGATITNTFTGQVVLGTITNNIPAGTSLTADPLPISQSLDTAGLVGNFGDTIYLYRNGSYTSSVYVGSWGPPVIPAVGEGFWYQGSAPIVWTQNFTGN